MRSLEQAFDSYEAGRIGAATFRSLVDAERRAAVRCRAGLAARDKAACPEAQLFETELSQANASLEAAEWCLNWIDEFEQLRVSAKSLFKPIETEIRAYS
jgi:hypothetical protein